MDSAMKQQLNSVCNAKVTDLEKTAFVFGFRIIYNFHENGSDI